MQKYRIEIVFGAEDDDAARTIFQKVREAIVTFVGGMLSDVVMYLEDGDKSLESETFTGSGGGDAP